jgi:dihydroneopterin aldolase
LLINPLVSTLGMKTPMPITSSKLFLTDFAVQANIGIHDFEKAGPQRLLISVEIEVEVPVPPSSDEIEAVLDYEFLRSGILDLLTDRHFNLQETLCREIIAMIAGHATVKSAVVSTRKPDVYPDCGAVGVSLTYQR